MPKVDLVHMHDVDTPVPYVMQNGEKYYLTGTDMVFMNAQCLFIEYTDIIKSPYFLFLYTMIRNPEEFSKMYQMDQFRDFGVEALSEWYISRKDQNPFTDLVNPEIKGKIKSIDILKFVNAQTDQNPQFIRSTPLLNFGKALENCSKEMVKKVIIWYPFPNDSIREDLESLYGDNVKMVTGPLHEVLKDVPRDSTYVFSDITNVNVLYDMDKLYLSSIIIPEEYGYNYIENGEDLKINVKDYQDEVLFKLDFFSNSYED